MIPKETQMESITNEALEDLKKSGLNEEYIKQMCVVGGIGLKEGQDGYLIPFFNSKGEPAGYHRTKLIPAVNDRKYIQEEGLPNHIYFPILYSTKRYQNRIIIVEGEKKAALLDQLGFLAVALTGINSWVTRRTIIEKQLLKKHIPKQVNEKGELVDGEAYYVANIDDLKEEEHFAVGMGELVSDAMGKSVIIIFDSDDITNPEQATDNNLQIPQVAKAAFELSYFLKQKSVNDVYSITLPNPSRKKCGVDDWILENGVFSFEALLDDKSQHRIPVPKNIRSFFARELSKKATTNRAEALGYAMFAVLENEGVRIRRKTGELLYFHRRTKRTYEVPKNMLNAFSTEFANIFVGELGLTAQRKSLISTGLSLMHGMAGEVEQEPANIILNKNNIIYHQISNRTIAKVSKDGVEFCENGIDDVFFIPQYREDREIQLAELKKELSLQRYEPIENKWREVVKQFNLVSRKTTRNMFIYTRYLSPWLVGYRPTPSSDKLLLPFEILNGEPGSGKTILARMIMRLVCGHQQLSGYPLTLRDWYTEITNTGAMWIGDNFSADNQHRAINQQLATELTQILTNPEATLSVRELYTTNKKVDIPVKNAFMCTCVYNPFKQEDLVQRSLLLQLSAIKSEQRQANFVYNQIHSRAHWLVHHYLVLSKFLKLAPEVWETASSGGHRLPFYEASMNLIAHIMGEPQISKLDIASSVGESIAHENDFLQALSDFRKTRISGDKFTLGEVAGWVLTSEYADITTLANPRKLAKYMLKNQEVILSVCKIKRTNKQRNRSLLYQAI